MSTGIYKELIGDVRFVVDPRCFVVKMIAMIVNIGEENKHKYCFSYNYGEFKQLIFLYNS